MLIDNYIKPSCSDVCGNTTLKINGVAECKVGDWSCNYTYVNCSSVNEENVVEMTPGRLGYLMVSKMEFVIKVLGAIFLIHVMKLIVETFSTVMGIK